MAYQGQKYTSKVMNRDGYVIMLPNVQNMAELLQTNPPDPYAESASQLFPLGTKLIQGERVWRYALAGASGLNIGEVQQQAAGIHAEADDDIAIGAASAIGVNTASITSTANLATAPLSSVDGFAEGYVYFNIAAGLGQCYKIKSHPAASGTDECLLTLYDALTIALTTSSKAGIAQNPFANVIVAAAVVSGRPVGVPGIAVTAAYYFWCQSGGPAAVAVNTTIALGTEAVAGTTAGKVDPAAAFTGEIKIGDMMTVGQTGGADHAMVYLTLDS